MLLYELFDNQQALQFQDDYEEITTVAQLSDNKPLRVTFTPQEDPEQKIYVVGFDRPREGRAAGDRTYTKSGEGNEVEVMSTVVNAIGQFIRKFNPNQLRFTAYKPDEDDRSNSRSSLYNRMVQRLAGNMFDVRTVDSSYGTAFVLSKKQQQTPPPLPQSNQVSRSSPPPLPQSNQVSRSMPPPLPQ